jgi:germination protein M
VRKQLARLLPLLLALALLCTACGGGRSARRTTQSQYAVYFLSDTDTAQTGETALGLEYRTLPQGKGGVAGLMSLLLSGPETMGLRSPFPQGLTLRSWRIEDGLVTLDLSEAYGGLSGVELSLADGCIVLTLCQLESVERVYLTVEGRPRPFRDRVYTPSDFLLDNGSDGPAEAQAELWFLQGDGLAAEERTLSLAVGDQVAVAALQALLEGPESVELSPVAPAETQLLSLTEQDNLFTVDLSAQWLEGEEDPNRLWAMVRTLTALEPEAKVLFQVEGQSLEHFGGLDLTEPLTLEDAADTEEQGAR